MPPENNNQEPLIKSTDEQLLEFFRTENTEAVYQAVRKYLEDEISWVEKELVRPITPESDMGTFFNAQDQVVFFQKFSIDKASCLEVVNAIIAMLQNKSLTEKQRELLGNQSIIENIIDGLRAKIDVDMKRLKTDDLESIFDNQKRLNFLNQLPTDLSRNGIRTYLLQEATNQLSSEQRVYNMLLAQEIKRRQTFTRLEKLKKRAQDKIDDFRLSQQNRAELDDSFSQLKSDGEKRANIEIVKGAGQDVNYNYVVSRYVLGKYLAQKKQASLQLQALHSGAAIQLGVQPQLNTEQRRTFDSIIKRAGPQAAAGAAVPVETPRPTFRQLAENAGVAPSPDLAPQRIELQVVESASAQTAPSLTYDTIITHTATLRRLKKEVEDKKPSRVKQFFSKKSEELAQQCDKFIQNLEAVDRQFGTKVEAYREAHSLRDYAQGLSERFKDNFFKPNVVRCICHIEEQLASHAPSQKDLDLLFRELRTLLPKYRYRDSVTVFNRFLDQRVAYASARVLETKQRWGMDDLLAAIQVVRPSEVLAEKISRDAHLALSFTGADAKQNFNNVFDRTKAQDETKIHFISRLSTNLSLGQQVENLCKFADVLDEGDIAEINQKLVNHFSQKLPRTGGPLDRVDEDDLIAILNRLNDQAPGQKSALWEPHLANLSSTQIRALRADPGLSSNNDFQKKVAAIHALCELEQRFNGGSFSRLISENSWLKDLPRVMILEGIAVKKEISSSIRDIKNNRDIDRSFLWCIKYIGQLPMERQEEYKTQLISVAFGACNPLSQEVSDFYGQVKSYAKACREQHIAKKDSRQWYPNAALANRYTEFYDDIFDQFPQYDIFRDAVQEYRQDENTRHKIHQCLSKTNKAVDELFDSSLVKNKGQLDALVDFQKELRSKEALLKFRESVAVLSEISISSKDALRPLNELINSRNNSMGFCHPQAFSNVAVHTQEFNDLDNQLLNVLAESVWNTRPSEQDSENIYRFIDRVHDFVRSVGVDSAALSHERREALNKLSERIRLATERVVRLLPAPEVRAVERAPRFEEEVAALLSEIDKAKNITQKLLEKLTAKSQACFNPRNHQEYTEAEILQYMPIFQLVKQKFNIDYLKSALIKQSPFMKGLLDGGGEKYPRLYDRIIQYVRDEKIAIPQKAQERLRVDSMPRSGLAGFPRSDLSAASAAQNRLKDLLKDLHSKKVPLDKILESRSIIVGVDTECDSEIFKACVEHIRLGRSFDEAATQHIKVIFSRIKEERLVGLPSIKTPLKELKGAEFRDLLDKFYVLGPDAVNLFVSIHRDDIQKKLSLVGKRRVPTFVNTLEQFLRDPKYIRDFLPSSRAYVIFNDLIKDPAVAALRPNGSTSTAFTGLGIGPGAQSPTTATDQERPLATVTEPAPPVLQPPPGPGEYQQEMEAGGGASKNQTKRLLSPYNKK